MRNSHRLAAVGIWMILGTGALAQEPLSAIDWLSESVTQPQAPEAAEENTTDSAAVESVTVEPIGAPKPDAAGLLPPSVSGLPRDLWGPSESAAIRAAIQSADVSAPPAISDLRRRLLLAEALPPVDSDGSLLLARIDALLAMGLLEDAQALMDRAGPDSPELFRRWFDVALLTGTENRACDALRHSGDFAPTYQARIFCLARNGDWNAAALTLNSADVLDVVNDGEYALISRFLDPELYEGEPVPPVPPRPTPLVFRMFEAIGEPLQTRDLPRAFAHADLRPVVGWKARIEAGERLARVGAIPANRLLGIYTERLPAASGGAWDRVDAFQQLELGLEARDPVAISETLPTAYARMRAAGLERVLAELFAERLTEIELSESASRVALELTLLSDAYEALSQRESETVTTPEARFMVALAAGEPGQGPRPVSARARAVLDGFDGARPPEDLQRQLDEGRLGEAILDAAQRFSDGTAGDVEQITRALRLFRAVGLEDTARQAALQYLIMGRQG